MSYTNLDMHDLIKKKENKPLIYEENQKLNETYIFQKEGYNIATIFSLGR